MKNRILRLALVVLAVAGQAAAGFFVYRWESAQAAARGTLTTLARDTARVQSMIGELRGAQAGMVGFGQDPGFWVPKIAALVQDTTARLTAIDAVALVPDAAQDRAAALDALTAFGRTTDRVRDLLASDQPLTASSLAFGQAAEQLSTASGALANVTPSQVAAVEQRYADVRLREAYALLGATAGTLLVLLLLLPRAGAPRSDSPDLPAPPVGPGLSLNAPDATDIDALGRTGFDLDIPRVSAAPSGPLPESPRESEVEIVGDLQRESQLQLNADAQVDLAEAARLCGDLARMTDGRELPAFLGRAADLLNASGIVLWIAEPGTSTLRPAASHGYSEHTLGKMKAIPVAAENAVAVAFRSGRTEIVRGTRDRNGAIVAPINAASGCAGAMAAELRHGAEASPAVQAVAAIVCAQLASLVAETTTPA
jgi:hypothetical protein